MHWFWRATLAVAINVASFFGVRFVVPIIISSIRPSSTEVWIIEMSALVLLAVVGISVYGILTYHFHPKKHFLDGETRCRKCGYILRGISEPRCSECGERI